MKQAQDSVEPLAGVGGGVVRSGAVRVAKGRRPTGQSLISPDWIVVALAMPIALVVLSMWAQEFAEIGIMIETAIATVCAGLARKAHHFDIERPGQAWQPYATMAAVIAMPMVLFGHAVTHMHFHHEAVGWLVVLSVLVVFAVLSGALLYRKLPSSLAAQIGIWFGASVAFGKPSVIGAIAICTVLAAILSLREHNIYLARSRRKLDLEREQRRAEELLNEYERMGQGWFWETDRRGSITYVSPTISDLLGRSSQDLLGKPFVEMFVLDANDRAGERTLNFHLSARSSFNDLAVRAAVEGEERWWSISGQPVHDSFNNFVGFRGSGNDLTEKRRSQEHATRLAHYDSLTGLANRFQMSVTLEKILNAQREDHRACAVFLLDLDRFKQVNDTMGHPAGDALLKQVAERLTRTVADAGRVGRLGGDEFQVVLPGRHRHENLGNLASAIIENLSHPYSIDGHRVMIGASIGIALSPDDGVTSEALIRNADLALYAAKDAGRGRFHYFDPNLHSEAEERRELEQDLRDAINQGGLELHYQPVVHTTTEKITGFEALLRWKHAVHGYISPSKFIPIAEDTGLVAQIGEWALRTACRDLSAWPEAVRVAVNVSPLQFANPALPAIVTSALAEAQVDPARLELEITESVFLNDDQATDAMFVALKRVGIRLALDDFGTGYSSLGYLKKAPFDKIKIDQSFVRGATVDGSRNGAIIASIVSLAEALGMETTAEGVETFDELDLVRELGCSHIQGFIYEKPLTAQDATDRLAAGLTAIANGPRSARAMRQRMLRKVRLEHGGETYEGTIRNISSSGAMIEGLWNVPPGTIFCIEFSRNLTVTATTRWCKDDRIGVEFANSLEAGGEGRVLLRDERRSGSRAPGELIRKAG